MSRTIIGLIACLLLGCGPSAGRSSDSSINSREQSTDDVSADGTNPNENKTVVTNELKTSDKSNRSQSGNEVDTTLLLKLRPGMTESEVSSLLGEPHEMSTSKVPAIPPLGKPERTLVSWTYNPGKKSYIILLFENGLLENGESGGYSIKSGLKVQLPK